MKKILFGAPLALIGFIVMYYIYCELNKAYWDSKVRELCEKDAGVTVYEKVEVSREAYPNLKFTISGAAIFPNKDHMNSNDPFFSASETKVLYEEGSISVFRFEQSVYRAKDGKKLSKHVSYGRRGGDMPIGISHPSYFSCGIDEKDIDSLRSVITIKGEE